MDGGLAEPGAVAEQDPAGHRLGPAREIERHDTADPTLVQRGIRAKGSLHARKHIRLAALRGVQAGHRRDARLGLPKRSCDPRCRRQRRLATTQEA
jgi:hypothetical protein